MLDRDHVLEALERRYVDLEVESTKVKSSMVTKEDDLLTMNHINMALEVELKSLKSQKKSFDNGEYNVMWEYRKAPNCYAVHIFILC